MTIRTSERKRARKDRHQAFPWFGAKVASAAWMVATRSLDLFLKSDSSTCSPIVNGLSKTPEGFAVAGTMESRQKSYCAPRFPPCPSLKVKSFSVGGFYEFVNAPTLNVV